MWRVRTPGDLSFGNEKLCSTCETIMSLERDLLVIPTCCSTAKSQTAVAIYVFRTRVLPSLRVSLLVNC